MGSRLIRTVVSALVVVVAGCQSNDAVAPPLTESAELTTLGKGSVSERFTAELNVRGDYAYTTTWGLLNGVYGNAIKIWNVAGDVPAFVDSVIVPNATTLGDVQVTDDGQLLIVATERSSGSIMIYSLADPAKPQLITRYMTALTNPGVHTAEVQRVDGKLYGFLCIDPDASSPARLVIVDLSNPASPQQVFTAIMGDPYVHDVFVRDGILFTALWDQGMTIWDIGGGGHGGTVANPVMLGNAPSEGGKVHNIWWFHNGITGEKKYAFIGEEGPGSIGAYATGDIHVIDVSNFASPREVAFYHLEGAGTHNFSVDETRGILYAAYYNAGVRAIDIKGDLSTCDGANKSGDGRCNLGLMGRELAHGPDEAIPVYVWGVQVVGGHLYASDMINGIWKFNALH